MSNGAIDFERRDDALMRREAGLAHLGNARLELGEELRAVRVVFQLRVVGVEIREERVVAVLFELVHVAVQVDADDSLHGV